MAEQSGLAAANLNDDGSDTIDKETADSYVEGWQSGRYSLVPSTTSQPLPTGALKLDSFIFSIDDFKEFAARVDKYNLNNPNEPITGAVCKIGIKPNPIKGGSPDLVPGLFFEPVVGFSRDPLTPGTCKGDIEPLEDTVPQAVTSARYDFSYPCPPTCAS